MHMRPALKMMVVQIQEHILRALSLLIRTWSEDQNDRWVPLQTMVINNLNQPNLGPARRDGLGPIGLLGVQFAHIVMNNLQPNDRKWRQATQKKKKKNSLGKLVPKQNEPGKHIKSRLGNWSRQASYKTSNFQHADVRHQPTNNKLNL